MECLGPDLAGRGKLGGIKGFADIRAYPPGTHPGMLVLRLLDESAASVRAAVTELVAHHRLDERPES